MFPDRSTRTGGAELTFKSTFPASGDLPPSEAVSTEVSAKGRFSDAKIGGSGLIVLARGVGGWGGGEHENDVVRGGVYRCV